MLVNCVAYQDGRKLADIAKEDIHRYLNQSDQDAFDFELPLDAFQAQPIVSPLQCYFQRKIARAAP